MPSSQHPISPENGAKSQYTSSKKSYQSNAHQEQAATVSPYENLTMNLRAPHSLAFPPNTNIHQKAIYQELNWFNQVLFYRFKDPSSLKSLWDLCTTPATTLDKPVSLQAPLLNTQTHYGQFVQQHQLQEDARLLLALGIAASLNDWLLYPLIELAKYAGVSALIGGELTSQGNRFLPTMQTFLFLVGGADLVTQGSTQFKFQTQHALFCQDVMRLGSFNYFSDNAQVLQDDWLHQQITLNATYYRYFMGAPMPLPENNRDLPITKLDTSLTFGDLVLPLHTKKELIPLMDFAKNGQAVFNDLSISQKFKKGFIALLHGAPGTGKTLIAQTIGKKAGLTTYQLELAQVVSKYIGETSKNINQVFRELEHAIEYLKGKPCVLFIDEADALVGKRSKVKDSKDRYANMDVSNLLQKLEGFPGLVIMASNFQQNFDPAIKRRIDLMIQIPLPEAPERAWLWENYRPKHLAYPTPGFARKLGDKFRLTGAQINNILKQVLINTYGKAIDVLDFKQHLEPFIKKEYIKNDEVYVRPTGLTQIDDGVGKDIAEQQRWWEEALPQGWQYLPSYLPLLLPRAIFLSQEEIQNLVTQAKRKWEGGTYYYLPWRQGLAIDLKELCEGKKLDWPRIQATIEKLIKEQGHQHSHQEMPPVEAHHIEIKPFADLHSTQVEDKPAEEGQKQRLMVPSAKDAPSFWLKALPEGFEFARKDLPKNLAKFYPKWSYGKMLDLIHKSVEFASEENTKKISYSRHISKALETLDNK